MAERTGNDLTRLDGINLDSLPKWLRDSIDINNEMADRDTGRIKRFVSSGHDDDGPDSEKQKAERHFNALMRLLQDPEYAALYGDAVKAVDDAADAAARALDKLALEAEAAGERLQELRDNAAELPDGRKVFRGEDGRLYVEDGTDVTDQRDSIRGLSANTTSWTDYKRGKETAEDIERRRREVEDYLRNVVNPAKIRLGDPNNPPSKDELEDILRRLKKEQPADVLAAQKATEPDEASKLANKSAADKYVPAAGVSAPPMFAQFRSASSVIGDDPFAPQPGGPKPV